MSDTRTPGSKHVAFIRGINVGRAKRVAMADLRALVEDLGYSEVRTVLNSGNIIFSAVREEPRDAARRIQEALPVKLGVSARVIALTARACSEVVQENSLSKIADEPSRLLVAFLKDPKDGVRLKALTKQDWTPEALALGAHAAYLWCPQGFMESRLAEAVGRALGEDTTTRNWATVMRIHALLCDPRDTKH